MTADELRAIVAFVQGRIGVTATGHPPAITFAVPTAAEMVAAGLDAFGVERVLAAPWFAEMVAEVLDTPSYCESTDPPELILRFARDVVAEYVAKRLVL